MTTTNLLLIIGGIWLIIIGLVFLLFSSKEYNKIDKVCPGCSVPVSEHNHICSECGRDLHKSYNESKRSFLLYGGLGLSIIGIVCIVITVGTSIL